MTIVQAIFYWILAVILPAFVGGIFVVYPMVKAPWELPSTWERLSWALFGVCVAVCLQMWCMILHHIAA